MSNLWKETLEILEKHKKTYDDVICICSDDYRISKDNYKEIAEQTNYYDGYGAQEVVSDLRLYGDNWYIERAEYDGSEWFEYRTIEHKDLPLKEIKALSTQHEKCNRLGWVTLKELCEEIENNE